MDWFYLITATVCMALGAISGGIYNRKSNDKNSQPLYAAILTFAAMLPWFIKFLFDPAMESGIIIYSLLFGICYASTNICFISALKHGSVSLSNLFLQFSLIVTSVWGLIFWGSELKATVLIGLAVAVISLALCLYKKESTKFNVKWLIWAILTLISNAGCAIIQKSQQLAFNFNYGTSFMFFGTLLSFLLSFLWFVFPKKPQSTLSLAKKCGYLPIIAGVTNFVLNLFIILLAAGTLSPSLIYPVVAIGGLAITSIISLIFFKEKLSFIQWTGIILGAVAVALLSL